HRSQRSPASLIKYDLQLRITVEHDGLDSFGLFRRAFVLNNLDSNLGAQRLTPQAADRDFVFSREGLGRHITSGWVGQRVADQRAASRRLPLLEGSDSSNRFLNLH